MKIAEQDIAAIRAFGYTEDEARFLYIVATHSGYFVPRQFLALDRRRSGAIAPTNWQRNSKAVAMQAGANTKVREASITSSESGSTPTSERSTSAIAGGTRSNSLRLAWCCSIS